MTLQWLRKGTSLLLWTWWKEMDNYPLTDLLHWTEKLIILYLSWFADTFHCFIKHLHVHHWVDERWVQLSSTFVKDLERNKCRGRKNVLLSTCLLFLAREGLVSCSPFSLVSWNTFMNFCVDILEYLAWVATCFRLCLRWKKLVAWIRPYELLRDDWLVEVSRNVLNVGQNAGIEIRFYFDALLFKLWVSSELDLLSC